MADETRNIVYTVDVNTGKATSDVRTLTEETTDLEQQIERTKLAGQKFADLLEVGAGLTGGVAAFQGITTLAGVENEKLAETLTRLMALQTTMSGLQQVANLFRTENLFLTKLLTKAIKAKNWVMKQSVGLQIAMTGGLVLLVAGIVSLMRSTGELTEEQKAYNEELKETQKLINEANYSEQLKAQERRLAVLKAEGGEQEKILELERKINSERVEEAKLMVTSLVDQAAANKLKRDALQTEIDQGFYIQENGIKIIGFREGEEKATEKLNKLKKDQLDLELAKEKAVTNANDETAKMQLFEIEHIKKLKEEEAKPAPVKGETFEEKQARRKQEAWDMEHFMNGVNKEIEESGAEAKAEAEQKELDAAAEQATKLEAIAKNSNANIVKNDEDAINKKIAARNFWLEQTVKVLDTVSNIQEVAMNIELKNAGENEAAQERIRKKYFEQNKKVEMAQALISTYQSATAVFRATALNPISVLFPAAPYIAAGAAYAYGASNVAKIAAQTYQGGSSGPAPVQASNAFGSTISSNTNNDNGSGVTDPQNITPTVEPEPIKVVVLASDITGVQDELAFVEAVSTL